MIKQQRSTDCGIATLANFLNTNYMDALATYGADRAIYGVTIQETANILFENGYLTTYIPFNGFCKASGITIQTQKPEILEILGRPAIVQVMNDQGVIHQVFFDGKNIHDPSPKFTSLRLISDYECVVDCLISFGKADFEIKSGGRNGR